jgi:hypothetical protein
MTCKAQKKSATNGCNLSIVLLFSKILFESVFVHTIHTIRKTKMLRLFAESPITLFFEAKKYVSPQHSFINFQINLFTSLKCYRLAIKNVK